MGTIKIDTDKAQRTIARYLRDNERMDPSGANKLADALATALIAASTSPARPLLHADRWRMIPPVPSNEQMANLAARATVLRGMPQIHSFDLHNVWHSVWELGTELPEGVEY